MGDRFESNGGTQNIGQGTGAIGQQNNYGVPFEAYGELAGKYAVTESALASFFKILEEQQVPHSDLDNKLREIAGQYRELLLRLETVQSEDPEVQRLKEEAGQAIEAADYAKAEELLNQAEARDVQAIEQLEEAIRQQQDAARQRRISAAASNVDNAKLQRIQLRYAKAAVYCKKAAALLPEDQKKERALYLSNAGYDFNRVSRYAEALPLYEQSLVIRQEIGDKAGEGTTLSNISGIHWARGDFTAALKYLEQSLAICREIGDKSQEGTTLNNISQIYKARGDIATALKYLEQSLVIMQEIGDKAGEGTTLNNLATTAYAKGDYATALKYLEQNLVIFREIGDKAHEGGTLNNISQIYDARGDSTTALKYLEQSLAIMQEIGAKMEEAVMSWNIGRIYQDQGDLLKAEQYMSRTVQLDEEIGHPDMESDRKALEELRAKLKGR